MHGVILYTLGKFVQARFGEVAWQQLLVNANLADVAYVPNMVYPDQDAAVLVAAAEKLTGLTRDAILESFGEFAAPSLLSMYGSLVDPAWGTLELLENIEQTIHRVVRMKTPGAAPPHLQCQRTAPHEVTVLYESERRMCSVAVGIIRGVAVHYREAVVISQPRCLHRGDPYCQIAVRRLPAPIQAAGR